MDIKKGDVLQVARGSLKEELGQVTAILSRVNATKWNGLPEKEQEVIRDSLLMARNFVKETKKFLTTLQLNGKL